MKIYLFGISKDTSGSLRGSIPTKQKKYSVIILEQIAHIARRSKSKHVSLISPWTLLVMVFKRSNPMENVFLAKLKYLILTFTWTRIHLCKLQLTDLINLKHTRQAQGDVYCTFLSSLSLQVVCVKIFCYMQTNIPEKPRGLFTLALIFWL